MTIALNDLLKSIEGLIVMSAELERTLQMYIRRTITTGLATSTIIDINDSIDYLVFL